MDKPKGNVGRSRGRTNNSQAGGNGRGRRNPQAQGTGGLTPTGNAGIAQTAWGNPNSSRRDGPQIGAPQPAATSAPSAWGNPSGGVARGPQIGGPQPAATSAPPAWGNPNNGAGRGKQVGAPQPVATSAPSSWRNPSSQGGAPQQRPTAPAALQKQQPVGVVRAATAESSSAIVRDDTRGAVRGRRVIADLVISRPKDLATKCGTSGGKVSVMANYFRVIKKPNWSIHQYRVDFSPDVDAVRLRNAYLAQHKELIGGFVFDGTVLFCTNYFIDQAENGKTELLTKNREGETIQIKIKHVGIVDATDIQHIQVLNLIVRRAMAGLNLQLVGRNFFDSQAKINLDSYQMQIWPGYQTSIRQHERDILMCAEIAHKVMRTETLYQILSKCCNFSDFQTAFKQRVVGTVVLTDYNNKTYRVDDVDFQSSPLSKFPTKDGEISYMDYYKKRYNIRIHDQKQPMLVSRPTEKNIRGGQAEFIVLIPELCRATGITDEMRNDFRLMNAMGEHTRLKPDRRIERLRQFNNRLQSCKASMDVLSLWDLKLDSNLVELPGRILAPEKIVFGDQKKVVCDRNAEWTREFRSCSMFSHVDIKRWYVVVPSRNVREVQDFVKMCIRTANAMKMHISEPRYEEMPDDRTGSYSHAIENTTSKDPQILLLVLIKNNEEKYSCIKKKCCVDRPVPSQCVTLRTIAPRNEKAAAGLMSIATKVVIQMNAKLMGAPWMIDMPLPGLMTVGFDVCHSAKDKNKSYGALVATMDIRQSSKYFSAVTQHLKGQELSNEITINMTCALKSYRAEHGGLPERILFFRDGVGDGQLHQVVNTELQYLKKKLDEIYMSAGVKTGCRLAFIIVSKRINTRYFVNYQNPVPGTVIDDIVTLPERYDFFLVSQSVRQGTVSPTSYNVIHDNMGLSADKLQILAYKMTHLYYNWSGTLRVPAVCQYAHKLAFLVAESIHRAPNNALENQLYFL